jgi:hypothetical protein
MDGKEREANGGGAEAKSGEELVRALTKSFRSNLVRFFYVVLQKHQNKTQSSSRLKHVLQKVNMK